MRRTVSIEPFGASFIVVLGDKALDKLFKQMRVPSDEDPARGAVYRFAADDGLDRLVMHLPEQRDEEVLWHEALHMATTMMDIYGIEISHKNDEVLAYLQGSIVRQVDRVAYARAVNRTKQKSTVE